MTSSSLQRIVAIVGRPNVGKSSLFNRIVGKRIAIVHSEQGVTRDRLMQEVVWQGSSFYLVDTGGIVELEGGQGPIADIAAAVRIQVEAAMQDAAAIIFVADTQAGLTPADEEVAARLRPSGRPIFLAANKTDISGDNSAATEFNRLGFPVFPVSAMSGSGLDALLKAARKVLPPAANREESPPLRVTVVGRPNVGKSSFLNRLLRSDRLVVSALPGTTRDSVDIPFTIERNSQINRYLLTDTAGMRRKGRLTDSVEFFSLARAAGSIARADVIVHLLDARDGPTQQDRRLANLALDQGKACVLAVNKWDLMRESSTEEYREALRRAVPFLGFVPVFFISARTGLNVNSVLRAVDAVASNIKTSLPTGILNRTLLQAYETNPPPTIKGRRLKIYYAAQTGNQPIRITLFVNDPRRMPAAFAGYLERILRRNFPLEGVPVRLIVKPAHDRSASKSRRSGKPTSKTNGPGA